MFHKTFEAGILNIDGNDVWKGFQGNNPPRSWAFRSHSKVIKKVMTTLKLEDINAFSDIEYKIFSIIHRFNFRCDNEMLCKSVTLDDCAFNEDLVIERKFTPTAIICQSSCLLYADCNTFSFNGTKTQDNCVLLTYDYRQSCKVNAGLEVGFKFNSQM